MSKGGVGMKKVLSPLGILSMLCLLMVLPLMVSAQAALPDETTLVIGQGVDVGSLEPSNVTSRQEANIFGHVFATLYEIAEDGSLQPWLANAYSISEDG